MPTIRARSLVSALSLAAVCAAPLALDGCARAVTVAETAPRPSFAIGFENEAPVQVDVYLVTEQREWRLGRVAAGARTVLRVPEAALQSVGFARLAVLADAAPTVQAAADPRAALTIAQPASELLAQRWTFWQPRFAAARILGLPVGARRQ